MLEKCLREFAAGVELVADFRQRDLALLREQIPDPRDHGIIIHFAKDDLGGHGHEVPARNECGEDLFASQCLALLQGWGTVGIRLELPHQLADGRPLLWVEADLVRSQCKRRTRIPKRSIRDQPLNGRVE